MKNQILIITLLVLFKSLALFAEPNSEAHQADAHEEWIYQETLKQCQGLSNSQFSSIINPNTLQAALISSGQSLAFVLPISVDGATVEPKYLAQNLISDYTMDRLNSLSYIQALNECFPGRPDIQKNYTLSMLAADTIGKIPAVIFSYYNFKITAAAFSKLKMHYPGVYKTLQTVSMTGLVGYMVYETRKVYSSRQLTDEEKIRIEALKKSMEQFTQDVEK